jgi:hypothetical protein
MCVEPLREAWATFGPMLTHVIQLLHCMLFMRFPICLVKLVEIWLGFLHICIHVKIGIVPLHICNKMSTSSPNTFILPLKHLQFGQRNLFYYLISLHVRIHVVGT